MLGVLRLLNISINEQRLIDGPITTAEPGTFNEGACSILFSICIVNGSCMSSGN